MRDELDRGSPGREPEAEFDPALLGLIREAGTTPLGDGAAARIAAGAWERADGLRTAAPARVLSPWRRVPRPALAAAAAVLIAVSVMSVRGSEPAFAVAGRDVVQVRDGGAWERARGVEFGQEMFAPADVRLIGRDGSKIDVGRGSVIRAEPSPGGGTDGGIVVFVIRGESSVSGDRVVVKSAGVEVTRDEHVPSFGIRLAVSSERGAAAPPLSLTPLADAEPVVSVFRGNAWVVSDGERMHLGRNDSARLVRMRDGATNRPRLALVQKWSKTLPNQLMESQSFVMDARMDDEGSLGVVVGAPSQFLHIEIPARFIQDAIADLNFVTEESALRRGIRLPGFHARIEMMTSSREDLPPGALEALLGGAFPGEVASPAAWTGPIAEFEHRRDDGRTVWIVQMGDGSYELQSGDEEVWRFTNLDALREAAPDEAALFGDALGR